jgi:hypothetical protein
LKHRSRAPSPAAPTNGRRRRALVWTVVLAMICLVSSVKCGLPLQASDAQATAVVSGRVLSSPGTASPLMPMPQATGVAGMSVTISDAASGKILSSTVSGSDGSFRFMVPPGDYSLKGPGNPHLLHVGPGQQLEVNLQLPNP